MAKRASKNKKMKSGAKLSAVNSLRTGLPDNHNEVVLRG